MTFHFPLFYQIGSLPIQCKAIHASEQARKKAAIPLPSPSLLLPIQFQFNQETTALTNVEVFSVSKLTNVNVFLDLKEGVENPLLEHNTSGMTARSLCRMLL